MNRNVVLMVVPQFLNLNELLFVRLGFGIKVSLVFYVYETFKFHHNSLFSADKNEIFYSLQTDRYFSIDNRIKNIFEIIFNKFISNITLRRRIKLIQEVYKEKYNSSVLTFEKYLEKRNLLSYDIKNKIETFKKLFNPFQPYTLRELIEKTQDKLKLNNEISKLKSLTDIIKSNNIWEKIPFFSIKNMEGSIIYSYVSPLKIQVFYKNYNKTHYFL